jgi:gamma-glutamylcyclotransferase (GGCT)/AIG2-like uncharacterized protein YtfP
MENLFAYGTLNDKEVQERVFGRVLTGTPDVLRGYVLKRIQIEEEFGLTSYPIITATHNPEDILEGMRYKYNELQLEQADTYEGLYYKRIEVVLQSNEVAWTYTAIV